MIDLIFNPITALAFFLFILLPLIAFVLSGLEYQNEERKKENKYHNLSKQERDEISKESVNFNDFRL